MKANKETREILKGLNRHCHDGENGFWRFCFGGTLKNTLEETIADHHNPDVSIPEEFDSIVNEVIHDYSSRIQDKLVFMIDNMDDILKYWFSFPNDPNGNGLRAWNERYNGLEFEFLEYIERAWINNKINYDFIAASFLARDGMDIDFERVKKIQDNLYR